MRKKTIQCSVGKSAKKHGWYTNEGDKGSVGVVPFWVRGSNVFGVGQIFFGMHQFFFGIVQNFLSVGQNFFVLV